MTGYRNLSIVNGNRYNLFDVNESLSGLILKFNKNETIPRHKHNEKDSHITICVSGSVQLQINEEVLVLVPGDVYDIDPDCYHSFVSLEDETCIINLLRGLGNYKETTKIMYDENKEQAIL